MRLLRWSLIAALIAGFGVLLMYRVKDPERRTLDDAARSEVPGRFVRLADGVTHYETAGPDTGRAVVLAAGFSVPAYIWDSLYQGLADSGFRVVRYDYYGRGWSDRPDAAYDQDLFVRQLAGLLDSLRITAPVDLAGVSFGGAIVTSFADRHPERVRSLLYFDPVFNVGRPLPPEERSARAWTSTWSCEVGARRWPPASSSTSSTPSGIPTGWRATGFSNTSEARARAFGAPAPRSRSHRTRRSSSASWARLHGPC
jgi:pimeloyl-ACP methyl ester carboxylesterase